MSEKILLEIIIALLAALLAGCGWLFTRHDRQHDELKAELAVVKSQREACNQSFATKGAMERAHKRIDEHEEILQSIGNRVIRLEACPAPCGSASAGKHGGKGGKP